MTAVPLGLSSFHRALGKLPPVLLKNMFVEKDPTNLVDGMVRLQRPGLVQLVHLGGDGPEGGPIRGIFVQKGTLDDDYLAVSRSLLHRVTSAGVKTILGSIGGKDRVQIAASPTRALIATGDTCYSTNGVSVTTVRMPDGVPVQSVAYINGYFILTQADSQRFYWIAPGQTNPDALSFASAENNPDNITHVEHLGDELWFFGEGNSTEVWVPTGDRDLPFQRVEGRLFDQGCSNRDTVAKLDNTVFWVGKNAEVFRGDSVPQRISDNSTEELLFNTPPGQLRAWAFTFQGHEFYCLTMGANGTRAYDVSTGTWVEFSSYGRTGWRAHMGVQISGRNIVAGDDTEAVLWTLDPSVNTDNGDPIVREVIGGVAILGAAQPCHVFSVLAATGQASTLAQHPVMQMRFSDDMGNTWSNWYQMPLGKRGSYGREVIKNRLGMMRAPGRLFHLKMSEDCMWRISYARVNESLAA